MLNHLIEFIARTHLLVLHFPIAMIVCAALVETTRLLWFRCTRRSIADHFRPCNSASLMFAFAFASTIVAITTGLILGYDYGQSADLHRILGLISGALILITAIALLIALRKSTFKSSIVYFALLCPSAGAVCATGHFGGDLTHGKGFLTNPLKQIINPTPDLQSDPQSDPQIQALNLTPESIEIYNTIIQPIFDNSCIKCHGKRKQKADLRLDSLAFTLDPELNIIERGSPDDSELIYLIELPADDEEIMPPQDEADPLTQDQIQSIRNWIQSLI